MLRFILILISLSASIFLLGISIRFGLKWAGLWDEKICNKRNSSFCGFNWYYRIPWAVGVIPEYFFYRIMGADNYFKTNWWAVRSSAYLSFLLFLAVLTSSGTVQAYYDLSMISESGIGSILSMDTTIWYLHMINVLYLGLGILITIESIRMHAWWAPVRMFMYGLYSIFMAWITVMILALLIAISLLYVAYRIIKFFMSSRRNRRRRDNDDNDDPHELLNNSYRRFRAELYAWEQDRKTTPRPERKKKKTEIKRKKPRITRKPRPKQEDNDLPRYHPD
jgi:hypothetical protein